MNGYMGKILKIDLSEGSYTIDELSMEFARAFLGGNGFAAKLIHDLVPPGTDPLSPDNIVVFASGPINTTPVWGGGRAHVASISPQTGLFADSNFGGNFGWMMKRTGYDAFVIIGKAARPVSILITDKTVEIRDAADLWGRTTSEAHRLLLEKTGPGMESAVIGPAGENAVVYANVICSGNRKSAAGRGGIGAVLGSKNCKAIAVKGTQKVDIARPEELKSFLKSRTVDLQEKAKALTTIGTPVLVNIINDSGRLGTHNNSREIFDEAGSISGELIAENYKEKNIACHGCPVACGKLVRVPHGEFAHRSVKMPEYETLYAIGSMIDNADIVSIFNANTQCDEMGLDTISFGVTLAFVAECLEKGIVTAELLGRSLSFGAWGDLAVIVQETAWKKGIGAYLAQGSEKLARRFGHGAHELLYCQQGMEMAGHSARGLKNMGLAYATSTRGGSHHDARPNYVAPDKEAGFEEQPLYCVNSQNNTAIGDSLVICRFIQERALGTSLNDTYLHLLGAITGWDITLEELNKIAERIYTLERLINTQRGVSSLRALLPWRVMNEPIPEGPSKGRFCPRDELEKMLAGYYRLRGWDENGVPTEARLAELRID